MIAGDLIYTHVGWKKEKVMPGLHLTRIWYIKYNQTPIHATWITQGVNRNLCTILSPGKNCAKYYNGGSFLIFA